MMYIKNIFQCIFLAVLFVLNVNNAHACTCPYWNDTDALEERIPKYGNIVSAKVLQIKKGERYADIKIKIHKSYKGNITSKIITIKTSMGNCGFRFRFYRNYLIYLNPYEGDNYTSMCAPTKSLKNSKADITIIKKLSTP